MVGRKQEEPTDKVTLQAHSTSYSSNQATCPDSLTLMFIPNSPLKMSCPEDQLTEPIWNLITSVSHHLQTKTSSPKPSTLSTPLKAGHTPQSCPCGTELRRLTPWLWVLSAHHTVDTPSTLLHLTSHPLVSSLSLRFINRNNRVASIYPFCLHCGLKPCSSRILTQLGMACLDPSVCISDRLCLERPWSLGDSVSIQFACIIHSLNEHSLNIITRQAQTALGRA